MIFWTHGTFIYYFVLHVFFIFSYQLKVNLLNDIVPKIKKQELWELSLEEIWLEYDFCCNNQVIGNGFARKMKIIYSIQACDAIYMSTISVLLHVHVLFRFKIHISIQWCHCSTRVVNHKLTKWIIVSRRLHMKDGRILRSISIQF